MYTHNIDEKTEAQRYHRQVVPAMECSRGRGRATRAPPTPEDPPLVIVDLVPKARGVGHGQLELHAFLLDDCGGEWREEGIGLGRTGRG